MPINNRWIKVGAINAALAVVLGTVASQLLGNQSAVAQAGGTSGFRGGPSPGLIGGADIEKAALCHLIHAVAIVLVGILMILRPGRMLKVSGWCFQLGVLFYASPSYLHAVRMGFPGLGLASLVGVVLLVAGWITMVEGGCPGAKTPGAQ